MDQPLLTVQSLQWEPGGKGAAHQLQRFLNDSLPGFSFNRAKTDRESTSRLSPHMHIGELSCRVLYHTVLPLLMCRLPILQEMGMKEPAPAAEQASQDCDPHTFSREWGKAGTVNGWRVA